MRRRIFSAFFFLTVCCVFAENVALTYRGSSGYSLVERTNLRRYVNGKYVGLTSREVRSFISPAEAPTAALARKAPDAHWYDGSFYVMEATKSNARETAGGIHDSIPSVFSISTDGQLSMYRDNGYPSFRSFPAFTRQQIKAGDAWKAQAERTVDPMNKGVFTRIPMDVNYQFVGEEDYKGETVYRIKAQWQTNYGSLETKDPRGDSSLVRAGGGHKADILVLKATGAAILIIDTVDETFQYADGTMANFKGTINLFTEFPPALDTEKLIPALQRIAQVQPEAAIPAAKPAVSAVTNEALAEPINTSVWLDNNVPPEPVAAKAVASVVTKNAEPTHAVARTAPSLTVPSPTATLPEDSPKNNIVVEKTTAGLRLSVRDIKFKSNSDEILPGEGARLDEIASVLALAPDSQFLIEGHTAAVGLPEGEKTLSEQRAHRIAKELSSRGVSAKAFICRGFGGTRPIADNSTDTGRAKNRRVEITILE